MSLEDALTQATQQPPRSQRDRPRFEYEWDGNAGFIQTGELAEKPKTWDEFIRDAGLNPDEVEVIEPVQVRGWDAAVGNGETKRFRYYRITVRRRTLKANLDDLVKVAKRATKVARSARRLNSSADSFAYLVALGDLQLGKVDGDGVEGTVARFIQTTKDAVARYKRLKECGPVYLVHLGDCIEGFMSQGGANAWRTSLTTTEQVRLYRRLLFEQIAAFAVVAPKVVVCGLPGNHDEAHRPLHTYGDSWAIDALSAVKDALEISGKFEHVTCYAPARDELTLTLDMCGTVVGMAHGHQFRAGQAVNWWAKQSHGRQPVGDADLLLTAHLHHLRIEHTGPKTWIQVPALESESTWYRHRAGEVTPPGVVTAVVGGGGWRSLEVLG